MAESNHRIAHTDGWHFDFAFHTSLTNSSVCCFFFVGCVTSRPIQLVAADDSIKCAVHDRRRCVAVQSQQVKHYSNLFIDILSWKALISMWQNADENRSAMAIVYCIDARVSSEYSIDDPPHVAIMICFLFLCVIIGATRHFPPWEMLLRRGEEKLTINECSNAHHTLTSD